MQQIFPGWRLRRLVWVVPIAIGILPAMLSPAAPATTPSMPPPLKNRQIPARGKGLFQSTRKATTRLEEALTDLSSDRYAVRQRVSAAIRKDLAGQLRAIIQAVGPEKKNRLIKLLRFDSQLLRWARAVLALPPRQRAAMFAWGLQSKVLPWAAGAFSSRSMRRAAAARRLAKISGSQADWILQRLLASTHRLVYLSAMAAIWNRRPSPAMVRIVWRRAFSTGIPMPPYDANQRGVLFHGRRIFVPKIVNFWRQTQDSGYARQLLTHWKPPELTELLVDFIRSAAQTRHPENPFSNPGMMQIPNYIRLFRLYKPPAAAPYLLRLLATPPLNNINFNFNNIPLHWDNHITPLYLLILTAGQDPAKYHFYRSNLYGGRWLVHTQTEENKDIKTMIAWWKRRGVTAWTPAAGARPAARPGTIPP